MTVKIVRISETVVKRVEVITVHKQPTEDMSTFRSNVLNKIKQWKKGK